MNGTLFPANVTPFQPTGFTPAQPGGKDQFEIGFAFRALTLESCNQLFYGFLIGYGAFFLFSFGFIRSNAVQISYGQDHTLKVF